MAVDAGYWPLYRWDPRKLGTNESPLTLDSKEPTGSLAEFMKGEARFQMVERADPERYQGLVAHAEANISRRFAMLRRFAGLPALLPPPAKSDAAE